MPNTESDYLDSFKSHYSDITIDLLHLLLHKEEFQNNDKFRLKIADSIFQHDSFNEEALRIKCSIFCRNDKMGIAKSIYDNFCKYSAYVWKRKRGCVKTKMSPPKSYRL
ncbi:MAG: hypothetical protein BHV68_09450 [Bacteroidales bacterium 43_8]|nr:MAG: hypothetical protein BHV68_09450 [Bacteroidales bacterium 43_8]